MLTRKRETLRLVPLGIPCPSGQRVSPEDAVDSVIPGLMLLLGWVGSGLGLRAEVEGRGSLAGLLGSCTSSGQR